MSSSTDDHDLADPAESEGGKGIVAPLIILPSGTGMTAAGTVGITRATFSSVILFAGTAESGKTTLLASLYHLFLKGPFADYLFAGSETLVGLEHRAFFSRTTSENARPTMTRTTKSEYLHLKVRKQDLKTPCRDVILCDLSGEDFRLAKNSKEACQALGIIRWADRFVLLIDGAKLTKPETMQQAKSDPLTLLLSCVDSQMLGQRSSIDVLFTKWDVVEDHADKAVAVAFADHIESELRRRFGERLREICVYRVAAHPTAGDMDLGHGLERLLPLWVEAKARSQVHTQERPAVVSGMNEYDQFYRRHLPEAFVHE